MESPYLNASESAQYLRITVKALYGLIERGKLKKLPGSRKIFFTKQQLDRYRTGDATDGPAPVRFALTDGRRIRFSLNTRKGGNIYFVYFRGHDGQRRECSTKCHTLKSAEDAAAALIREDYTPPEKKALPFVRWDDAIRQMGEQMAAQNLRQRTVDDYKLLIHILRKVFSSSLGPADITPKMAQEFKAKRMSENYSALHRCQQLNKLSVIWQKWFIDRCKVLAENPWADLEPPKCEKGERRHISDEEKAQFFNWLSERWKGWRLPLALLEVKWNIGCRISELCSLATDCLQEGRVVFETETTKGRKTRRCKLPAPLFAEVKALAGQSFVWERFPTELKERAEKGAHLVLGSFDSVHVVQFLHRQLNAYFDAFPTRKRFTLHNFRGTAMSRAKQLGVSWDDAAIAFDCAPETMRRYYVEMNETKVADDVFDRIQQQPLEKDDRKAG